MKNLIGLILLLLVIAAYYGWAHRSGNSVATAALGQTQMRQLAASVKAEEVVMSAALSGHIGKKPKSVGQWCEAELKAYGGNGTLFLVILRNDKECPVNDEFLKHLHT